MHGLARRDKFKKERSAQGRSGDKADPKADSTGDRKIAKIAKI